MKTHPSKSTQSKLRVVCSPKPSTVEEQIRITELEREIIDFFVQASQAFGIPKSVGEIYGLFFISERALALDDVIEKLQISKGSASQGIRFLREIYALIPQYQAGDRRDHFIAETSLRRIAEGFIKERIRPQIQSSSERIKSLKNTEKSAHLRTQLKTLEGWNKKGELILPFATKFLGAPEKGVTL